MSHHEHADADVESVNTRGGVDERGFSGATIALAVVILGAIVGLVVAFALHDYHVGAFIGIGFAAAFAPVVGMIFLAWAIDNDENSHGTTAAAAHGEH